MPIQAWNTTDFSDRQQFAVWREVICEAFGALDPHLVAPDDNGFPGRVRLTSVEAIRCALVEASPHLVLRSHPEIRRDPQEAFFVNLQLAGSCMIRQDGRETLVRPGDFAVLDLTSPYAIDTRPGFSIICFRIPRDRLLPHVRDPRRFAGRTGLGDSASGRVAASFMHAMWSNSHDIPGIAGAPLGNILAELVGLALAGETAAAEPSAAAALRTAYGAIERRLGDPDLTPAAVAHEMRISVRSLHAIFQRSNESFSAHVRTLRLQRCADDLRNIADRRSISEIAWRWGFNESAHFSRLFRDAYGVSPREFRVRQAADRSAHRSEGRDRGERI